MALGGLVPVPQKVLMTLVIALAAIWIANNVAFVGRIVRARNA